MKYIKKYNEDYLDGIDVKLFIDNLNNLSEYTNLHPDYFWVLIQQIESAEINVNKETMIEELGQSDFDLVMNWKEIKSKLDDFTTKLENDLDDISTDIEINESPDSEKYSDSSMIFFYINVGSIQEASVYKLLFDEIQFLSGILDKEVIVELDRSVIKLMLKNR